MPSCWATQDFGQWILHDNFKRINTDHCLKSVRTRSYSGPYFPAFRLNTERYRVSPRILSKCGKIWTRINPNTDTFYAVDDIC